MGSNTSDELFVAPGPGEWTLDRSHFPCGTTPIAESLIREAGRRGVTRVFAEIGVPAECVDQRFVNGFMYTRLRPLIGADKPMRKPPPTPMLWAVARVHPAFGRDANRPPGRSPSDRRTRSCSAGTTRSVPASSRRTAPCRTSTLQASTMTGSSGTSGICSTTSRKHSNCTSGSTGTISARSRGTSTAPSHSASNPQLRSEPSQAHRHRRRGPPRRSAGSATWSRRPVVRFTISTTCAACPTRCGSCSTGISTTAGRSSPPATTSRH